MIQIQMNLQVRMACLDTVHYVHFDWITLRLVILCNLENTWKIKSTKNTSLVLENLLQNQEYAVRVIAETRAGRGNASELIFVRIFIKKPPQDQPGPDKTTMEIPPEEDNKNHLGMNDIYIIAVKLYCASRRTPLIIMCNFIQTCLRYHLGCNLFDIFHRICCHDHSIPTSMFSYIAWSIIRR